MELIRTSFLNGIAVFIRMLSFFGINKILAVMVGPAGFTIVGQFQNLVQMITTFSSGAVTTGVTKYTAQEINDEKFQVTLWKTAGTISIVGTFLTAILICIFEVELSEYFLKNADLTIVFRWFAAFLIPFVLNSLLLAILNGRKEIRTYVICNISGSVFSLILTIVLAYYFGLSGALIALGTYQSVAFFLTLFLVLKRPWFKFHFLFGALDREMANGLFHYTLMALASAVCVPLSFIFVRELLIERLSVIAAGNWEAMSRMSAAYLMFITSTLSVYFLPRISELRQKEEVRQELKFCLRYLLPLLSLMGLGIYLFRASLIKLLFSEQFSEVERLVPIYLMGDVFKVIGWMLGYVMIARGLVKDFVFGEIFFSLSFYGLIHLLIPFAELEATAYAHFFNYIFYAIYGFNRLKSRQVI